MKQQLILTLACGLLGGAVGAAIMGSIQSAPESEQSNVAGIALLGERLDELAEQNKQLRDQVVRLEDRPMISAPVRTDVKAEELPSPEEERLAEMLEELQQSNSKGPSLPENFKLQVGSVLEEIRASEEQERDQRREKAREERRERQLQQLAEKLGMDAYQTNEMRTTLAKQDTSMRKAREEIRESGDWTSMRTTMHAVRDETIQSISLFLTPTQVTQYQETNSDHAFGGGFRGNRGGRGGSGGGGRGGGRNSGG